VATYLLTEGHFVTMLEAAAIEIAAVAAPLGVHPSLVRLVWTRYDDALG
jgi:sirohydrochlorin ferrochelatase